MSQGDFIKEICGCLTGLIDKRNSFNSKNIFLFLFYYAGSIKNKTTKKKC